MKDMITLLIVVILLGLCSIGFESLLLGRLTQKPTEIRIHIDSSFCDTKEVEE